MLQLFSQTLIRSNDYSHNDCKSSLKAILLNKVVVGKGCKLLQDNTSLTAPPTGYDSVSFFTELDGIGDAHLIDFVYKGFSGERGESELRRAGSLRQRCYKAIFSGHVRALALNFF